MPHVFVVLTRKISLCWSFCVFDVAVRSVVSTTVPVQSNILL